MRKRLLIGICFLCFIFSLSACTRTHHQTKKIAENLQPSSLYEVYKTEPLDLNSKSKCSLPPTVIITNIETRNENYLVLQQGGHTFYINPQELTGHIVDYMKDAFVKGKVRVDNNSTKVIQVSLKKAEFLTGVWNRGAGIKLKIDIPEIQYTKVYEAEEWSVKAFRTSMAYAVHFVTWKIIADPVVQNYVLCK